MIKSNRKKKSGIKILILLMVIALLLGGVYYFLITYTVKTVQVEGNVHYTKEEIEEMILTSPLERNSVYLSILYKDKQVTDIPFIASLNVEVISPDTIKIKVFEKKFAGYVDYLGRNMYFDQDGVVIESSKILTAGVPEITGLTFDHIVLNEPLPVEDEGIFYKILTVTKALDKYGLSSERIYFDGKGDMTLYFGTIRVAFGSDELLDEKISLLEKEMLPKLEGQSGTLDLRNYDESTQSIPFQPDKEK